MEIRWLAEQPPRKSLTNLIEKQATDPNNNSTQYQYDPLGTLTRVTDPKGKSEILAPNYKLGVIGQTDAVGNQWEFSYDAFGNLNGTIDGRGSSNHYVYDQLNRLTEIDYNYGGDDPNLAQSSVFYAYQVANPLITATDTNYPNTTIRRRYDALGNLTSEATGQGTVSYTYDAASRRATMSVPNQSPVNYLYDNANQLCAMAQGSSLPDSCPVWQNWTTGELLISRYTDGLTSNVFLPDGAEMGFAYNNDYTLSAIGGFPYSGSPVLYFLDYSRDAAGRLTQVTNNPGAPPPTVNVPAAVVTATYLANNQLNTWNATSVTENDNGNVKLDAQGNKFTWNERNQLSAIAVPTAGGTPIPELLQYDAFGRRQHVQIYNGPETSFLYDGLNPVQEQPTNASTVNLLTGLGLDEVFTRTDSSGTMSFLTDAIGSTYGLLNSSGSLQTQYSYGPFGQSTPSGTTNPYQFTGREIDPNSGLYFMRNRYYSPALQRFISPDPSGLAGGDANLYSYVRNDPTNLTDPSGLGPGGVYSGGSWYFDNMKYTRGSGTGGTATSTSNVYHYGEDGVTVTDYPIASPLDFSAAPVGFAGGFGGGGVIPVGSPVIRKAGPHGFNYGVFQNCIHENLLTGESSFVAPACIASGAIGVITGNPAAIGLGYATCTYGLLVEAHCTSKAEGGNPPALPRPPVPEP